MSYSCFRGDHVPNLHRFLTVSDGTESAPSVALSSVQALKMLPLPTNGRGLLSPAPFQYETTPNPIKIRQQVALIAEDEAEDGDLLVVEPWIHMVQMRNDIS